VQVSLVAACGRSGRLRASSRALGMIVPAFPHSPKEGEYGPPAEQRRQPVADQIVGVTLRCVCPLQDLRKLVDRIVAVIFSDPGQQVLF